MAKKRGCASGTLVVKWGGLLSEVRLWSWPCAQIGGSSIANDVNEVDENLEGERP